MKLIRIIDRDPVLLIVRGDFDAYVCERFRAEMDRLVEDGVSDLEIDLRYVKFLSSRAVGELLRLKRVLDRLGGQLDLIRPSAVVRETLAMLKLDELLLGSEAA